MNLPVIIYVASILFTALVCGYTALFAWMHRHVTGARSFALLAFSEFLLALTESLSVFSPSAEWALFWFQIRYTSLALIGIFWLIFSMEYGGKKEWLSKPALVALFVIPLVTQISLWSGYQWVNQEAGFSQIDSFWIADISVRVPGPGFLVHSLYTMLLVLAGIVLMLVTAWKIHQKFTGQALLLAIAAAIAALFGLKSIFNLYPQVTFNPFTPGIGLSVILIALAVFRFQFLLEAPGNNSIPRLTPLRTEERRSLGLVSLVFMVLAVGIAVSGYVSYVNYERQYRAQVDNQLSAITELKVHTITDWHNERLGDAEFLRRNPAFAALVQAYSEDPNDQESKEKLQAWLNGLYIAYEYEQVLLLDTNGVERLAVPPAAEVLSPLLRERIAVAIRSGQVECVDFHLNHAQNKIRLTLAIPIYAEGDIRSPVGVVILRINPEFTLYPYLQEWPSSSETAETLLVRREGNYVVFLSPLRFQPEAALNLRIPLTETSVLAVKAALGQTGIMEGRDYRNHEVIGAAQPVPGTPWFIISRIDKSEIYAPLQTRLWQTFLFIGVLTAASGAGLLLLWRQQSMRHYRQQIDALDNLRVSEERFELAFETSPDAIAITRLSDGMFISVNKGFEQITGYRREEVLGKTSLQINIWKYPEDRQKMVEGLLAHGEVRNYEAAFLTQAGEIYGLMSAVILQLDGETHVLNITRDITERQRAEQQLAKYTDRLEEMVDERTRELQQAQEQLVRQERLATLGQLAGSIGHELRNPLGVISNAAFFLRMSQPDASEQVREYLDIIENETRISDKIITDLLDFTRIKSIDRQAVSVSDLIGQTLGRFSAPSSVQVTLKIPPGLPRVFADPSHVVQVLGNLITNAHQAMPMGGNMVLSAHAHGDMIALAVQDTGIGIPPDHLKKLFEPLFTTKTKGIGLGLAVSQKLAEANGGRIEVQSEPGKGSTFTLFLPIETQFEDSADNQELS